MSTLHPALIGLIFVAALLYSAVGHGGASGYLAVMALWDIPPEVMRPLALTLNVAVALIGTVRFTKVKLVPWRLAVPLLVGSLPMAFVGGSIHLAPGVFKPLLACVLVLASLRLGLSSLGRSTGEDAAAPPNPALSVVVGAFIGLLAGLTGTGGGIFLSPLVLLLGWAGIRKTAGASAVFILGNSIFGLLGTGVSHLPEMRILAPFMLAAVSGGLLGSWLGTRGLSTARLRRVLALVLVIAAMKLAFT